MWKTVEDLSGMGEVYEGQKLLGRVRYEVKVYRESRYTKTGQIAGVEDIKGRIFPVEEFDVFDLWDRSAALTLNLSDGRRLDFFLVDEKGTIANRGGKGLYKSG